MLRSVDRSLQTSPPHHGGGAASPNRVVRKTVAAETTDLLREMVLRGELPEGTPVRQQAFAAQLGVSRVPVREALIQLEAEGLVTFHPHRGAVVARLSLEDIEELYEIRAVLEPYLLRCALPHLTSAALNHARGLIASQAATLRRHTAAAWGAINWEFHWTLLASANRPRALALIANLHRLSDRYSRLYMVLMRDATTAQREHRAILARVAARDGRGAARLLERHILHARHEILSRLVEQRAAGRRPSRAQRRAPHPAG